MNREEWLTEVARRAEPVFTGFRLKAYRVTCGWPSRRALSPSRPVVGQCHGPKGSAGKFHEIFISPALADPAEVAGTLLHEMAHVAAGVDAQHGSGFVKVCKHVGLTKGKPTNAMPGELLAGRLEKIVSRLGEYPHSALRPPMKLVEKAPSSIRLECPKCGCKVSISPKWLIEAGLPTCGCGTPMLSPEDLPEPRGD